VTKIGRGQAGNLEMDANLLDAAGILPYETIVCCHVNTGEQFLASILRGPRGGGDIVLNGPLIRAAARGDSLIIFRYEYGGALTNPWQKPHIIRVDSGNRILKRPYPSASRRLT
jgi:aspartate 1-decarboxylase